MKMTSKQLSKTKKRTTTVIEEAADAIRNARGSVVWYLCNASYADTNVCRGLLRELEREQEFMLRITKGKRYKTTPKGLRARHKDAADSIGYILPYIHALREALYDPPYSNDVLKMLLGYYKELYRLRAIFMFRPLCKWVIEPPDDTWVKRHQYNTEVEHLANF